MIHTFCKNFIKFIYYFSKSNMELGKVFRIITNSKCEEKTLIYTPSRVDTTNIGYGSYIAAYSNIQNTTIGRFCSIGPNFFCGYGIHPLNGISTSPMFYSTKKQNGYTLSKEDKIEETKPIKVGNDVFIGANVTILDGVVIGDGAVIGAGAVVTKNIPPYAIAVGVPAKVVKYRFNEIEIESLLKIKWWDWPQNKLKEIELDFFNVSEFILKNKLKL